MSEDDKDQVWGVILAGGLGTRFWPRSRRRLPKQCLDLLGDGTMIQRTVARIVSWIPPQRILVVTGVDMADVVMAQLPNIPAENFLVEPSPRSTAPALVWASRVVAMRGGQACVVLPSDHSIGDEPSFLSVLRHASAVASEHRTIALVGMRPTFPHTGYGYILAEGDGSSPRVERFIEKPPITLAEALLRTPHMWWNAGVFTFPIAVLTEVVSRFLPGMHQAWLQCEAEPDPHRWWELCEDISFDRGILERVDDLRVVPCDVGWSDVGSWTALTELRPNVEFGTLAAGDVVSVRSRDVIVDAPGRTVALVGVSNLIVVDTGDVLMIASTEESQRIGDAVTAVERCGRSDLL